MRTGEAPRGIGSKPESELPGRQTRRNSDEPRQHFGRDPGTELRRDLEQAGDVGEILLALARAAGGVERRPDLALEHVLEPGHRDGDAQDLPGVA